MRRQKRRRQRSKRNKRHIGIEGAVGGAEEMGWRARRDECSRTSGEKRAFDCRCFQIPLRVRVYLQLLQRQPLPPGLPQTEKARGSHSKHVRFCRQDATGCRLHLKRRPRANSPKSASSECKWCSFHCRYTSALSSSLCTAPGTASHVKNTGSRRISARTAWLTTEPGTGATMRMVSLRLHTRRGLWELEMEKGMLAVTAMMSPLSSVSSSW
jgi:hypothetical protein